jgi:hypothetical protein
MAQSYCSCREHHIGNRGKDLRCHDQIDFA